MPLSVGGEQGLRRKVAEHRRAEAVGPSPAAVGPVVRGDRGRVREEGSGAGVEGLLEGAAGREKVELVFLLVLPLLAVAAAAASALCAFFFIVFVVALQSDDLVSVPGVALLEALLLLLLRRGSWLLMLFPPAAAAAAAAAAATATAAASPAAAVAPAGFKPQGQDLDALFSRRRR